MHKTSSAAWATPGSFILSACITLAPIYHKYTWSVGQAMDEIPIKERRTWLKGRHDTFSRKPGTVVNDLKPAWWSKKNNDKSEFEDRYFISHNFEDSITCPSKGVERIPTLEATNRRIVRNSPARWRGDVVLAPVNRRGKNVIQFGSKQTGVVRSGWANILRDARGLS